jgi:hypothetical protein
MTTHKSPLDEAIENLVARGDVEVVGHEEGNPVYYLTEAGLQRHALKTGSNLAARYFVAGYQTRKGWF